MSVLVRSLATVPRTATPMAPASCSEVLTIPDAMPASVAGTLAIAIVGSGGVGGYFGGRLAAAGADVTFLARGAHLEAMRRRHQQVAAGLREHEPMAAAQPHRMHHEVMKFGIAFHEWSADWFGKLAKDLESGREAKK